MYLSDLLISQALIASLSLKRAAPGYWRGSFLCAVRISVSFKGLCGDLARKDQRRIGEAPVPDWLINSPTELCTGTRPVKS
jgi:hypothetical protein